MTDTADPKYISVEENGQIVAQATMTGPDDTGEAQAAIHVAAGHLPVGTRRMVVDAVEEAVTEAQAQRLKATVPRGDAELVEGIREQLNDVQLRAAGATSIIEGTVRSD